jgi:hypothetical protein
VLEAVFIDVVVSGLLHGCEQFAGFLVITGSELAIYGGIVAG